MFPTIITWFSGLLQIMTYGLIPRLLSRKMEREPGRFDHVPCDVARQHSLTHILASIVNVRPLLFFGVVDVPGTY